jgi:hypothetical protein
MRIIKPKNMRLAGYVARTGEINAYMLFVGKPEGKIPIRRPRRRWKGNVKRDRREIEWGSMHWIYLAQDRVQWRALLDSVLKLGLPENIWKFCSG